MASAALLEVQTVVAICHAPCGTPAGQEVGAEAAGSAEADQSLQDMAMEAAAAPMQV